ncbi:MAG: type II toxin-antitoxin system VapC family toxin [Vicinamibacterales bacterium]
MPILLDTHAWVWWVTEDRRLSRSALRLITREQGRDGLLLSAISIWEVAKRVEKRQLILDRPVDAWIDAALHRPGLHLVELARPILVESCRLPQPFHGDPADQLIVATARDREATIVTKDQRIDSYPHVRSTW